MKTIAKLPLTRISAALLFSGLVGASAFAGPGPQFWARAHATPAPVEQDAANGGCTGCSTTMTFAHHDRGPAGVGVQGVSVVATQHACTHCGGAARAEKGVRPAPMVAASGACGAMVCCR